LVKGDIRAANVYAGRHAKLVGGMAAGNDGSLHVSGKLRALYLHQVTGTIGENAVIDHQLSDCDLTVGFDLDARGATVSGGIVRVGRHAAIDVLGSGDESPTRVVIGSLGKLESLLDELHAMTPDLQADHDAKRAAIHEVEKQGQPQAEITELREAFQAVDDLLPRIEAGLGRVDAIRDKQRSAKLWVTGRVLPGAVVDFGQTAVRFTEPVAGPFGLRLNGSEPVLEFPADHDTVDLADVAEVIDGSTELAKESARAA
ncbi:MAG: FapA family protein, partial [Planctomycetota bacterium]